MWIAGGEAAPSAASRTRALVRGPRGVRAPERRLPRRPVDPVAHALEEAARLELGEIVLLVARHGVRIALRAARRGGDRRRVGQRGHVEAWRGEVERVPDVVRVAVALVEV